jgi:hypothetical protein
MPVDSTATAASPPASPAGRRLLQSSPAPTGEAKPFVWYPDSVALPNATLLFFFGADAALILFDLIEGCRLAHHLRVPGPRLHLALDPTPHLPAGAPLFPYRRSRRAPGCAGKQLQRCRRVFRSGRGQRPAAV